MRDSNQNQVVFARQKRGFEPSRGQEKRRTESSSFFLAGDEGFEPPNVGTKSRCLTTWRIPSNAPMYYTATGVIAQALEAISPS